VAAGSLAPRIVFVRPIMPELVEHMRRLDGALVLFENTPHRDMDTDSDRDIEPAPVTQL
jgi:hypothetical protein